jgi:hypothetical protein
MPAPTSQPMLRLVEAVTDAGGVRRVMVGYEWDFDGAANNNNTDTVFIPALGPAIT